MQYFKILQHKLHSFNIQDDGSTRGLLAKPLNCGITLLFQPPYSPDFNTCEFCFRHIKDYLRFASLTAIFAEHETKIAIAEAILQISPENSFSYFCHCGYVF